MNDDREHWQGVYTKTHPEKVGWYEPHLQGTLKPDGHVIIATFSPQAPTRCSGLDVIRYDPQLLQAELGTEFRLRLSKREIHYTPSGIEQEYLYCHFQRAR